MLGQFFAKFDKALDAEVDEVLIRLRLELNAASQSIGAFLLVPESHFQELEQYVEAGCSVRIVQHFQHQPVEGCAEVVAVRLGSDPLVPDAGEDFDCKFLQCVHMHFHRELLQLEHLHHDVQGVLAQTMPHLQFLGRSIHHEAMVHLIHQM